MVISPGTSLGETNSYPCSSFHRTVFCFYNASDNGIQSDLDLFLNDDPSSDINSVMMCCSECAAETAGSSGPGDSDVVGDETCIGNDVPDADDHVCHATDVESDDAAADDMQVTPTQPTVDIAAVATDVSSNAAQSRAETPTDADDTLVKDDVVKLDEDVQPESDGIDYKPTWYFADIKKLWRKFNIDLMPKVIRGHLIVVCWSLLDCGRHNGRGVLFAMFLCNVSIKVVCL